MKRTPFFEAVVPAPGIPWLEPQGPEVRLTAPPLPAALLLQALSFFRAVYTRYAAEAVALLAWREATRTYELVVPHQTVGGATAITRSGTSRRGSPAWAPSTAMPG